ncbi:TfoX/Sxy family protein [Ruegeria faecimaris]|uniref:TfoX/Sxy family protein n=1 Tax=Ruegeria faecimaris TaxID=686389 RepID=UPI00232BD206|nr:TfoX/Sxy family protein [Ruegeria faecimaris]
MSDPISTIRNLGPAYEQACARAGIHSAQQLREIGPDAAYAKLLQAGSRPHFIGYYVLVMGLQGRPWNDCKGEEKKALRQRFDAIKASNSTAPETKMIADLDAIGVRVSSDDLKPA